MRTRFARRRSSLLSLLCLVAACKWPGVNPDRFSKVSREEDRPERLLIDFSGRPDSLALARPVHIFDTDEEGQSDKIPPLPYGMTDEMIRDGDRLFRGKGGCTNCHGSEAQGLAARGKTLTAGLHFIPSGAWAPIDSLISVGMPDRQTRSTIAMPPRGQHENLDADEVHAIGAYVWAISQVKGEPWRGGHVQHAPHDWRASARTSIP